MSYNNSNDNSYLGTIVRKINRVNDDQSKIIKRNKDKIAARIYREKMSKFLQEKENLLNLKENKNNLLREDIRRLEEEIKMCQNIYEREKLVNNFVQYLK